MKPMGRCWNVGHLSFESENCNWCGLQRVNIYYTVSGFTVDIRVADCGLLWCMKRISVDVGMTPRRFLPRRDIVFLTSVSGDSCWFVTIVHVWNSLPLLITRFRVSAIIPLRGSREPYPWRQRTQVAMSRLAAVAKASTSFRDAGS